MNYSFIPDSLITELIQLREVEGVIAWRLGDITNEIRDNCPTIPIMQVYDAVGSLAGKSKRTVREYALLSRFYEPEVRQEFCILAIDHFRHAMLLDKWSECLKWCMEKTDDKGRPATVDAMLEHWQLNSVGPGCADVTTTSGAGMAYDAPVDSGELRQSQASQRNDLSLDILSLKGAVDSIRRLMQRGDCVIPAHKLERMMAAMQDILEIVDSLAIDNVRVNSI